MSWCLIGTRALATTMLNTPHMCQPACVIMIIADDLASNRQQGISNHHMTLQWFCVIHYIMKLKSCYSHQTNYVPWGSTTHWLLYYWRVSMYILTIGIWRNVFISESVWGPSQYKDCLSLVIGIPIIKMRQLCDSLIFIMGIPILVRQHFVLRWRPELDSIFNVKMTMYQHCGCWWPELFWKKKYKYLFAFHSILLYWNGIDRLLWKTRTQFSHVKKKKKKKQSSYVANILLNYQWPLLLTWINFNPNMDK